MTLEQGAICDYCDAKLKPYEKVQIRWNIASEDSRYKVVQSSRTSEIAAYDLCPLCAEKAAALLEKPVKRKRENPLKTLRRRHLSKFERRARTCQE